MGLLYLLYRNFEKVCLIKPYTSRPANSERYVICEFSLFTFLTICRYIVCYNLLQTRPPVTDYLFKVNEIINAKDGRTVTKVVADDEIDEAFAEYVKKSNSEYVRKKTFPNFYSQ